MSSQLPPMSATCCKKFNLVKIWLCFLRHFLSNFVAESTPGYMSNVLVPHRCKVKKICRVLNACGIKMPQV